MILKVISLHVINLCIPVISGVKMTEIEQNVIVHMPAKYFVIPCQYSTDNMDNKPILSWYRERQTLLTRLPLSGTILKDHVFMNKSELREGCTLQVNNPTMNDSGTYTVTLISPYDKIRSVSAVVNVTIFLPTTPPSTTIEAETFQFIGNSSVTTRTKSVCTENQGTTNNKGILIAGVIFFIISLCGWVYIYTRHKIRTPVNLRHLERHLTQV